MDLYIHYGLYKVGSSYLQYICANNKNKLIKEGVYFPSSDQDQKMKAGLISAGNAHQFSTALKSKNKKKLFSLLAYYIKTAENNKCTKILLSAEDLAHSLSLSEGIEMLNKIVNKTEIKTVFLLGYFREIVDHAISTYKHRAKTGRHPDFDYWIKNEYETPALLYNLKKTHDSCNCDNIEWTFNFFKKEPSFLAKSFFEDWLNIQIPQLQEKKIVNQSVTLSEVLILSEIKKEYPYVIDYFMEKLKNLPYDNKSKDYHLETAYRQTAILCLTKYQDIFDKFEYLLQVDMYSLFDRQLCNNKHIEIDTICPSLSRSQLKTLIECMVYFNTFKGRIFYLKRKIIKNLINI